jgi:hypothetical protein
VGEDLHNRYRCHLDDLPSGCPGLAKKPYSFHMLTNLTPVLNEIIAVIIWRDLLQLHRLFAIDASHQVQ